MPPKQNSQGSTSSKTSSSVVKSIDSRASLMTIMQEPSDPGPLSSISLDHSDLPHTQSVCLMTPLLQINIGTFSVIREFIHVAAGKLHVTRGDPELLDIGSHRINVREIPTSTELILRCSSDQNILKLRLIIGKGEHVDLTFHWEE
jgi:hypothetical protein